MPNGVGRKADPKGKSSGESAPLLNALAAALAQSASPAAPAPDATAGDDNLHGVASVNGADIGVASALPAGLSPGGTASLARAGLDSAAAGIACCGLGGPGGESETDSGGVPSSDRGVQTTLPPSTSSQAAALRATKQFLDTPKTLADQRMNSATQLDGNAVSAGKKDATAISHPSLNPAEKPSAGAADDRNSAATAGNAAGFEPVTTNSALDLSVQVTATPQSAANPAPIAAGAAKPAEAARSRSVPVTTSLAPDSSPHTRQAGAFPKPEEDAPDQDGNDALPGGGQDPASLPQANPAGTAQGYALAGGKQDAPPSALAAWAAEPAPSSTAPPPTPAAALHPAQVLERMDKAEIRIGLQTENFGAIRLHTTVAGEQVGAALSTSHLGLRDALLVEAPSLERAMARHSLHLDSVSVDAGSANSNFNTFGGNERQPQARPELPSSRWTALRDPKAPRSADAASSAGLEAGRRLDVRA